MPTKNPIIQTVVDEETMLKFRKLCEKEGRTSSNMMKKILKEYLEGKENKIDRM